MTSSNPVRLLLVLLVVGTLALAAPELSSATFTSTSRASAQVSAAADWTPPSVAVVSPGAGVKDVVTVAVDATDGESGVREVVLEQLAPGGTGWTALCTDTTAPYTCTWDTRALPDGQYSLRARATDRAGYETTSATVRTVVANKLLVVLADPGETVRGTIALSASVHSAGTLAHTVRIEYAAADSTSWRSACTGLTSPYACSWSTTGVANGDYDLRAVLVAGSSTYVSEVVEVTVDNAAPTVAMVDPGTPLSGTRAFTATASDAHSGVARVVVQYAPTGATTYRDLCTVDAEPYTCRVATSTLTNGSYSFRAVATDVAGNTATSAAVTNRVVDNTVSSVAMDDPGSPLSGTVALTATASSTAGVASVRIQVAPSGTTTWTDVCTDTTAPYGCSWNSASVPGGLYDFRAVLTEGTGRTLVSAIEDARLVDNSPLRGLDVQTSNGNATPGKAEAGDTITFTYSSQIDPAKVLAGWNGTAREVTARFRDGNLLGRTTAQDGLDVLSGGTVLNLGSVNLRQDYVKWLRTVQLNATMTAGTFTTPEGLVRSTVTLRLGTLASGSSTGLRKVTTNAAMVWSPSAAVTTLQGQPCSTTLVTETGTLDREF